MGREEVIPHGSIPSVSRFRERKKRRWVHKSLAVTPPRNIKCTHDFVECKKNDKSFKKKKTVPSGKQFFTGGCYMV